jgi:lipoate-protein ligase A
MSEADLEIRPYDLPDAELLRPDGSRGRAAVFVPERVLVVIGKGSDTGLELNSETILHDGIPVLRRSTGGCAVVLTPEMAAISFAVYTNQQKKSTEYFGEFNRLIIETLEAEGVSGLAHRGISDIALGGKKIAGTALYRNRELIFYHAILNLAGDTELMERYLKAPPREPDYREQRSHRDFVTSLAAKGFHVSVDHLQQVIVQRFSAQLERSAATLTTAT